jgi:hypothetical protein
MLLVATPLAASGTLAAPELADPAGDIRYFPGTPEEGHDYIDILAGFASHDATSDRINLTLALYDTTPMEEHLGDWRASCTFETEVQDGPDNATLQMVFEKDGSAAVAFDVFLYKGEEFRTVRDDYTTSMTYGQPGFSNWSFAASYLRSLGTEASNFSARCSVMMRAAGAPTLVVHSDDGSGDRAYAFPAKPEGSGEAFDPADDLPADRRNGTGPEDEEGGKSPAVAAPLVLLIVAWVAARKAGRARYS